MGLTSPADIIMLLILFLFRLSAWICQLMTNVGLFYSRTKYKKTSHLLDVRGGGVTITGRRIDLVNRDFILINV